MEKDRITEVEKKLDKVLSYLHNDEGTGTKGLVADFAEHKKAFIEFVAKYEQEKAIKKEELEIKKSKLTLWGALGGSAITGAFMFLKWLFTGSSD